MEFDILYREFLALSSEPRESHLISAARDQLLVRLARSVEASPPDRQFTRQVLYRAALSISDLDAIPPSPVLSIPTIPLETSNLIKDICRICRDTEGEFITPCQCKGSLKYVHADCLSRWRRTTSNPSRKIKCEICLSYYHFWFPFHPYLVTWIFWLVFMSYSGFILYLADWFLSGFDGLNTLFKSDQVWGPLGSISPFTLLLSLTIWPSRSTQNSSLLLFLAWLVPYTIARMNGSIVCCYLANALHLVGALYGLFRASKRSMIAAEGLTPKLLALATEESL